MATNFPNSLDNGTSLPYPSSSNLTNSPSLASGQDNQNDSLIAIQNKLGITASTPTVSNLLIGTGAGTSTWSKLAPAGVIVGTTDSQTLTNKTLTSPTITGAILTNANITTDLIAGFTTSNSGTVFGVPVTTGVLQTAGTVSGASLVSGTVGTTALATNAVQANQLATNAITLGYAQTTSNFISSSSTVVQVPGLTITVTIPAGARKIKITAYAAQYNNGSATVGSVGLSIWDGVVGSGTQLALSGFTITGNGYQTSLVAIAVVTPASGTKTYNVGTLFNVGTSMAILSSSIAPSFILVEAI